MISINDILITKKIRKILGSKNISLSEIIYKKLYPVLRKELNYDIKLYTNKSWNKFKQTSDYSALIEDIGRLFVLGYGCKFIALCLTIKYKIFISFHLIHTRLNKNRINEVIDDEIFNNSNISIKGRIIYNKNSKSFYLTFKCANIRDLSRNKRIGVKVFFNNKNKKVFLERDDRAAKKITVHSNDLFISLYPLANKIKEFLKNTDKTYKSISMEVNFNSNNFGYQRYELIDDSNARLLFLCLQKFGFNLE
ncbi:hypothetical protein KY312_03175 [Candidatus Woesearchaeota archaeon]|nr:hypothetical protein [Candidatus Woesearchaeota archaeon]